MDWPIVRGAVLAFVLVAGAAAAAVARGAEGFDAEMATVPLEDVVPPSRPEVPRRSTQEPTTLPATRPADAPRWAEGEFLTGDWGAVRGRLNAAGIIPAADLSFDATRNVRGGRATNGAWGFPLNLNVNVTVQTQPLMGWAGGSFFVNFQHQRGGADAARDVGDYQGANGVIADGRTQVSEVWYEQKLFDDALRVKVGKVDANGEFAFTDFGADFVHGYMSVPIIDVLPTYPDPAFGANVFGYARKVAYAGVGAYDGALQEGVATGGAGPGTAFGRPADLFLIGEAGAGWAVGPGELSGRVRVGGWRHTGTFDRFDGGEQRGAGGAYAIVDQLVWREGEGAKTDGDDYQGIGAFLVLDAADQRVFGATAHVALGVTWKGAVEGRDADVMGLGASYARFSTWPGAGFRGDGEAAVEAFYKVSVTPFFSVKGDVQYVTNPGGVGADNAVVPTVRVEVKF